MSQTTSSEPNHVETYHLKRMLQEFNEELGQYINAEERYKIGRVLTIIDASFADPEQRKAVKNIVNDIWWGGGNRPSESKMVNPHTDLRAICKALGFELYDDHQLTQPVGYDEDLTFEQKRYKDAVNNR